MRFLCVAAIVSALHIACGDDTGQGSNNQNNQNSISGVCGDGELGGIEECDDGSANSDIAPDACRTDCTRARCGDSVKDSGEECDDGPQNHSGLPNVCRLTCALPACGDGIIDTEFDETCDDGNTMPGDGCSPDCRSEICGDGDLNEGEECDDGAGNSNTQPNACRADCRLPYCGDGVVDTEASLPEACDDGSGNADLPNRCRVDCSLPACGDGILDNGPEYGEACDHGESNADLANHCRTDCSLPVCGDGLVDTAYGETCDEGAGNSDAPDATCRTQCTLRRCGDGIPDVLAGEECDEGNLNGDLPNRCRATCLLPRCGDGIMDSASEQCDLGSQNSNQADAACRLDCSVRRCGDGILDPTAGETCDEALGVGVPCAVAWGAEYVGCSICDGSCHASNTCILCPGCTIEDVWINYPGATSTLVGVPSELLFSKIVVSPIVPALSVEVGYGSPGTDPAVHPSWQWFKATPNPACQNCQGEAEFMARLTIPAAGTYDYTYRYTAACPNTGPFVYPLTGYPIGVTSPSPGGNLVINEVDYDQIGGDTLEFVELYNGSAASVDLAGLALVLINGSNNTEYLRVDLSPVGSLEAGAFLVIGSAALVATVPAGVATLTFSAAQDNVQNGAPDALGLVDLDSAVLLDALSYEGSVTAGVVTGIGTFSFVEGTALSATVEDSNSVDGSLCRKQDGQDSDDATTDWTFCQLRSPGAPNVP